jgi:hypothetical protein
LVFCIQDQNGARVQAHLGRDGLSAARLVAGHLARVEPLGPTPECET